MFRPVCTLLLVTALPVAASAQTLGDAARRAEEQRKTLESPDKKYTANSLPGPGRIDAILGEFVMTDTIVHRSKEVEINLVKARRLDLALDRYMLKWEFATRGEPLGMAEPMQREAKVLKLFDRENLDVRDYLFFHLALDRARLDRREPKFARGNLSKARVANLEFLERNESLISPRYDLQTALDDLERDRKYRARE